jgi:3-methylfumaryl-CoA hydratase
MAENFANWIGRSVTRKDAVTERLLAEYRATLEPFLFSPAGEGICPPGFHWGLAPAIPRMNELGPDGTEAKGLFLPPIPLARRMWAGGMVETFAPISIGMDVMRLATISDFRMRDGKTGPLCFVSVTHEIKSGAALLVRERQDLVFRDGGPKATATPAPADEAKGDVEWTVETLPALLFRFSAFTFNGHRVHYDFPYATESEGYSGLLVHGPLQAALLLNQASTAMGRVPARFDYRCMAPLSAGPAVRVTTQKNTSGAAGRIVDCQGVVTIEGISLR